MLKKRHNPGCQCCCQACLNDAIPSGGFQIEVAGVVNGAICTQCVNLDGTFVMSNEVQACEEFGTVDSIAYNLITSTKACVPTAFGNYTWAISISWDSSTNTRTISVGATQQLSGGVGGLRTLAHFELSEVTTDGPYVCTDFDELDIPFVIGSDTTYCDASGATCLLSAA